MARIRTLKPELPEDEKLGQVSRDARLTFILLLTCCDDHGRFRASPIYLRNTLFPYDEDASTTVVTAWLYELADIGRIRLYTVEGERYGVVPNWAKHQRIDNAGKPIYPAEDDADPPTNPPARGEPPQSSANLGETPLDLDLDLDQYRPPAANVSEPDPFDAWWAEYPRKEAKKAAAKAYRAALKLTDEATLLSALAAARASWAKRDRDHIPHASTWLNGERWGDVIVNGSEYIEVDGVRLLRSAQ